MAKSSSEVSVSRRSLLKISSEVLLHSGKSSCHTTSGERTIVDIGATVTKQQPIISCLLAAHALTGCDTVARPTGIVKIKVIKQLDKGIELRNLGEFDCYFDEVAREATTFIAECYGKGGNNMSYVRYDVRKSKLGWKKGNEKDAKTSDSPNNYQIISRKCKAGPFFQSCVWKSSLDPDPSDFDNELFWWRKDFSLKVLAPVTVPDNTTQAPSCIMKLISCSCSSETPCVTNTCEWDNANLVKRKLGMSSGTSTSKLDLLHENQHKKRKVIAVFRAAKQRRNKTKLKRNSEEATHAIREGPTYASNEEHQDVDITIIPAPLPKPGPRGLNTSGKTFVYFDLETTGLERTSHITQIAAVHNSEQFSRYVIPKQKISTRASQITGITMVGNNLFHNGSKVEYVTITQALTDFSVFLKRCHSDKTVILTGHNIESFDCKVLLNSLHNCGKFEEVTACLFGFLDTYTVFKYLYPHLKSHSQEKLVQTFLGETYSSHSAIHDVLALQKLVKSVSLSEVVLNKFAFGLDRANKAYLISQSIASNIKSLQTMIDKKIISAAIARSIAGSGLNFNHLCNVYGRNGLDGIRNLLSEKTNGIVRVTRKERIIAAIANYVSLYH